MGRRDVEERREEETGLKEATRRDNGEGRWGGETGRRDGREETRKGDRGREMGKKRRGGETGRRVGEKGPRREDGEGRRGR
jgi:hypothetical protein